MREVCPNCDGDGTVQNIRAVIDNIFVALEREIFFSQGTKFSVVSNDRTIGFMKNYGLEIIDEIERNRAVKIDLMVDRDVGYADFRIVSG
jgi:Ribonuclease G/E